jgi:TonB family protein
MNIQFFGKMLNEVFITASAKNSDFSAGKTLSNPLKLIYFIYFAGAAVFLLKLIADLLNLALLISRKKIKGSRIIHFHGFNTSGFSAMGYIFLNSGLKPEEAGEIIKHEQNHLSKKHFFDIIFIEMVKSVLWFNPVVYLFNRSLRAIHEFQADQECLCSGVPIVNYQNLLLNQVFKSGTFNLTNSFSNPSLIKRRMIMMTKKRTSGLANLKQLMVFPVVGVVFMAISAYREAPPPSPPPPYSPDTNNETGYVTTEPADEISSTPFVVVEEMPKFPGGDQELLKYISQNIIYPENAKKYSITGRVIVRFCIEENGTVSRVSVLKGVDPDLDAEAIRVVSTLPAFKPGRQGGKAVPVWYMVPITYALK